MQQKRTRAGICVALQQDDGTIVGHVLLDKSDVRLLRHRWSLHKSRDGVYAKRTASKKGKSYSLFLHRAVLGLEPEDPRRVDHINGDTLDCRRSNLRIATTAQNAQNQGSRGGSSEHRGVTWDKSRGKWVASAMLNGRRTTIGRFVSEAEAAEAACAWRAKHMPSSLDAEEAA